MERNNFKYPGRSTLIQKTTTLCAGYPWLDPIILKRRRLAYEPI